MSTKVWLRLRKKMAKKANFNCRSVTGHKLWFLWLNAGTEGKSNIADLSNMNVLKYCAGM